MSHLSHVCGQQGLQFLHDKQTQGADWAGHLLQTGQADQQEQKFKFHFHIHIRFLMLTWSPVAVPSSDVETSLLAESWGSFCSSSFLLEAQSPNSTHVSPGFCAHTYYLALDVEQKCSFKEEQIEAELTRWPGLCCRSFGKCIFTCESQSETLWPFGRRWHRACKVS